ncbi:MAG: hypothetical protein V4627_01700 [Pseudomonadota bacterium]
MSYAIHIWDQPTPANWPEAQAVFERLCDQRAALNPKFVALAQRMRAAFPQYGDEWDFGSPNDLPNDAVLAVDIHDLTVFYPRLVDAAVALGLSVYDDSTGECFVPGPWRLSSEGRERLVWIDPAPAPAKLPDIEDRVRALVHPRLAAHGFRQEVERSSSVTLQTRWLRDVPLGKQWISLGWKSLSDGAYYEVRTSAGMRPVLPGELVPLCDPQPMVDLHIIHAGPLHRFVSPLRSGPYDSIPVEISKASQLDDFLAATTDWLEAELLPVLDQCRTVPGLLAYDLGEPRQSIAIKPYQANLALAYWAGASDVERRFALLLKRCVHHNMTPFFLNATHRGLQGDNVRALFGTCPGGTA